MKKECYFGLKTKINGMVENGLSTLNKKYNYPVCSRNSPV